MNFAEVLMVSVLATGIAIAIGIALGSVVRAESRR